MRKNTMIMALTLMCTVAQRAWAWEGSGTSTDPYLINNTDDWQQLASDVSGGETYSKAVFRMTVDIDADGVSVGANNKPFCGTFDGDGHTLTYNRGENNSVGVTYVDDFCAPFVRLDGATIRHLNVTGTIWSKHIHAAGIASLIDGTATTTIFDCNVNSMLQAGSEINADASFAGLVGNVNPTCTASPVIKDCTFTGGILGWATRSSGLVGYTNMPIAFENCLFDPSMTPISNECATFVRMAPGVECTFDECYYTVQMGTQQGKCAFTEVLMPDDCTAEILGKPKFQYNGKDYYTSGAQVLLTVPEGTAFDHWVTMGTPGCFLNDPWTAGGIHTLTDVRSIPILQIATAMPATVKSGHSRNGFDYRYLSNNDYLLYMSDSLRQARGYNFDDEGSLYFYDAKGKWTWITVITSCDPSEETFQNFYRDGWFQDKDYEGCIVLNDLVSTVYAHSHLFAIAPHAFQNVKELKRLTFISDNDGGDCNMGLEVAIQEQAFKNSGIEELVMMYRNEKTSSWEAIGPKTGVTIADNAFDGTDGRISVAADVYQSYMNDDSWRAHHQRLGIYASKVEDMSVNGAVYSYWRNGQGEAVKNDAVGHETLMTSLRYWNTIYKNFNAVECLAQQDEKNIWYAQVVGADASYLRDNDGKMRIYNDPGSYYNYKTLAIARHAFKDCTDLKAMEFWQTNGRSENSYSDLKMVIENGAFQGCTNFKEMHMFYKVEDGTDRWVMLGPDDVVVGDNIFGIPTAAEFEAMSAEERDHCYRIPKDFKILVATDRYGEFLEDPNWIPYIPYIEPVEYDPYLKKEDFTMDGLTYGYLTSAGGIMRTSQTVSQDLSWWSALKLGYEVFSWVTTIKGWVTAAKEVSQAALTEYTMAEGLKNTATNLYVNTAYAVGQTTQAAQAAALRTMLQEMGQQGLTYTTAGLIHEGNRELFTRLAVAGIINNGTFTGTTNLADDALVELGMTLKEELLESVFTHTATATTQRALMNKLWWHSMTKSLALKPVKYAGTTVLCAGAFGTWAKYKETTEGQPTLTDGMLKGMRNNLLANIHQWGSLANGLLYATPTKNLVYHTYLKAVPDDIADVRINVAASKKQGMDAFAVTMNMSKTAFQGKTNVQKVRFYDDGQVSSNVGVGMCFTIPDSAFAGCTNLRELRLILETNGNGTYALGPENFILSGEDIFVDVDTTQFHIVIDPARKEDFINNESWAPLQKYFAYENARPQTQYTEYGVDYAYAYEMNTIKKEHKSKGHLVEHTVINGANNEYLDQHSGTAILINDIGVWNNYQLDGVPRWAFSNNKSLRRVLFADLKGWLVTGASYSDVDITLEDSCFVGCDNLDYVDLLYMVTDQKNFASQIGSWTFEDNHLVPLTPQQIKIGRGVFENSPKARLKMMPQQVAWFEADSAWAKYRERFLPVVFHTDDKGVASALKPLVYNNLSGFSPEEMGDYIDLSRVLGKEGGFDWLYNRFRENSDIYSFADFKLFEHLGLNYVGFRWFLNCTNMNRITLPSTIQRIKDEAFKGCTSLTEIELPAKLDVLEHEVFAGCTALQTIIVRNPQPPLFSGSGQFPMNEGMRIYVPDESLDAYLNNIDWKKYKDYIVRMSSRQVNKVVTVTEPGQLAEKLGLTAVVYDMTLFGEQFRRLDGYLEPYDSLTVNGPINGLDLAVLRYLAGCDTYTNNGAMTDGRLRYLNLANAQLKTSSHFIYTNQYLLTWERYTISEDNCLPKYAFCGCNQLETLVLPKSLKAFKGYCFNRCDNLRKLAIGGTNLTYEQGFFGKMLSNPLDELVFYTETAATSSDGDPWGADINNVYVLKPQMADYSSQLNLTKRVHNFLTPFDDDAITRALFDKGEFFPSSYLMREDVEGLFQGNSSLTDFGEFCLFEHVKHLDTAFKDCDQLRSIFLPSSIETIGAEAFAGCVSLDTIRVVCDSVPVLAPDAFESLPNDFRILVPKSSCKLYRTKWPQYADHINVDETYYADDDIIVVTLTEPNTLAEKLGLTATTTGKSNRIIGLHGDYSKIRRLKVNGLISGSDFDVMKYLAGYCPWTRTRNLAGHLEYIDLYGANIVESTYTQGMQSAYHFYTLAFWQVQNDKLPYQAFLKCYPLKTLILPRTCKAVADRALQECEGLETLVVGDDMENFNWNALDDDASLTRMYILAKQKMNISSEWYIWQKLCNNYNPTFDAFYVRPSLYQDYLEDENYTSSSWQRTNNVSKGEFDDDDSFCAFAVHAAATQDDLANVTDVEGWFSNHPDVRSLKALAYTSIDTLHVLTIAPLTKLAQIALPATLNNLPVGIFANATQLQSIDMLQSSGTNLIDQVRKGGFSQLGIDTLQTLVYLPADYGKSNGTNVVALESDGLHTRHYRLPDGMDYLVPYAFKADTVSFARQMQKDKLYSLCLPCRVDLTGNFKLWQVDTREGAAIVFKETTEESQPLKPYLVQPLADDVTIGSCTQQTIPASEGATIGQSENFYNYTAFRGTLKTVDDKTARELPAYVAEEAVTALDNQLCSTGTWTAAQTIQPFTAFLLPGADGTFTLKLKDSGELVLNDAADNQPQVARYDGKTVNTVRLQGRTLWKDGMWNTLCLPFSLNSLQGTPLEGAVVKTLSESSFANGTLTMNFSDDLPAIEAGKPYLVKWVNAQSTDPAPNIENPVFETVTVSSGSTASSSRCVDFLGSFSPVTLNSGDRSVLYVGSDDKLYYPEADVTVGACRAFFQLKGIMVGDGADDIRAFFLDFGDSEETSISEELKVKSEESAGAWFDMQGRRLSGKPTTPGLYINNGIKVAIK